MMGQRPVAGPVTGYRLEPYDPEPRCEATRGPRSTVRCEMPAGHERWEGTTGDHHNGRGRVGQWFWWPTDMADLFPDPGPRCTCTWHDQADDPNCPVHYGQPRRRAR